MGAGRHARPLKHRAAAAGLVLVAAAAMAFWRLAPSPLFSAPQSAVLLARDGTLLGARIAADGQWRFLQRRRLRPQSNRQGLWRNPG